MHKIIDFPIKDTRDWGLIKKTIQSITEDAGTPAQQIETIISRMKVFYNEIQFQFNLNVELPEEYQSKFDEVRNKFLGELHEYTNKIMLDRLILEIKYAALEERF